MSLRLHATLVAAVLLSVPVPAHALPRFAARNGAECILCHVNPTGGGIRNAYGRNVFARTLLPWSARRPTFDSWLADDLLADERKAAGGRDRTVAFSPDLTDWLAVGADARVGYFLSRPDSAPRSQLRSKLFLMHADLYLAATVNEHAVLVFDYGPRPGGPEMWALLTRSPTPRRFDLMLKLGWFRPPFGVREAEHQLFTREGVGFGVGPLDDHDAGIELTAYAGPLALHVALLDGGGDKLFDETGALAGRLALRARLGRLKAQVGGSFYGLRGIKKKNPLFGGAEVDPGLDELRAGAFLTASLGRFTYLADLVYVRDDFYGPALPARHGYASYQELSFVPAQGLDLIATLEFKDPDLEVLRNATLRAGLVTELHPWPSVELRAMVRRTRGDDAAAAGWDLVVLAHLFM